MKHFAAIAESSSLVAVLGLLFTVCLLLSGKSSRAQASQSGPPGQTVAADNKEQPLSAPADAKPLTCPAAGAAIELASGDWRLAGDCTTSGLSLRGDARIWSEGLAFTVAGNVSLQDNAGLHIHGGSFNVANQFKLEYHIDNKGKAVIDIRDAKVMTNAGVNANLTTSYVGSDDSLLHIENSELDHFTSWILANLHDRARLETKDSAHCPSEIYPSGSATVRIEGPKSGHAVWLRFNSGATAALDGMPDTHPFTFSFGRNTPGVTGIAYQVDVVNGDADFPVISYPGSNVTVKNTHVGIGYEFANVTAPETLTGLKGGQQTVTLQNQGRVLNLENATLPPYGWQVYSSNDGVDLSKVAPVNVSDALINEMGASNRGWFEVNHVQFAFAAVAAVGPSSRVHVRNSVINSHTIMGNADGVVTIEDSEIYGSRVQAIGHSRILLLDTALLTNEPNPKCVPVFPSLDGKPRTRCNPYNPEHEIDFVTQGQGIILVAGIDPIAAAIRSGEKYAFVGNAIVKTIPDTPFTYNLHYRRASGAEFTSIVNGATEPKREQPLGQLDTTGLAAGDYIVELQLIVPGQDLIAVQRAFRITKP